MNNFVFEKPMENVGKHIDIKLVATKRRSNYLVSKPSFDTTKFSTEVLLAIEMKKLKCLWINLSILDFKYKNKLKY